jgi:hypothetical protein
LATYHLTVLSRLHGYAPTTNSMAANFRDMLGC